MNRLRLSLFFVPLCALLLCALPMHRASVVAQEPDITVYLSDGTTANTSVLTTESGQTWLSATANPTEHTWPINKVSKVSWLQRKQQIGQPEFLVKLIDQSLFAVESFAVVNSNATIKCKNGFQLVTSTRNIEWVRHKPNIDALGEFKDASWVELLTQPLEKGDALVINREQSLDFLEGIVGDVTTESVAFKFGERDASVGWDRVAGIRYYHATGRQLPGVRCIAKTIDGDEINVTGFSLTVQPSSDNNQDREPANAAGSVARFETPCSATIEIDASRLVSIDWASTSIQWLDEFKPAQIEKIAYLANPKTRPLLEKLKQPSFSETIQGNSLSLVVLNPDTNTKQLRQFEHGIQVSGSTRMIWLFDGKFKRIIGNIGFDPRANANGSINIKIFGDRKSLFEKDMTKEENNLVDLDLDVTNVRRLTIEIDGGLNTAGDIVNFCNLRATK